MFSENNFRLQIKEVSPDVKIIVGGKKLPKETAIKLAFPNSPSIESYGFKIHGDDLQIRKYNFRNN